MILEMVIFDRPGGASDAELLDDARATVPRWQANAALERKLFAVTPEGQVAGIYVWPSRAAARAAHDAAWIEGFRARTGQVPTFRYFDLFMEIDNVGGRVREWPLEGE